IDVSMLEATIATMGWAVSNWLIAGAAPQPMGNDNMTASPSGAFKCKDGLLNIAANEQSQFVTLCRLIDRQELLSDQRFARRDDRKRFRQELKQQIEKTLIVKPAQEWSAIFNQNGVPAGEVLSIPEVLEHPQIIERRLIKHFPTVPGVDRDIATVRAGFKLASGDPAASIAPPALGADTEQILLELGYNLEAIARLRNAQTL